MKDDPHSAPLSIAEPRIVPQNTRLNCHGPHCLRVRDRKGVVLFLKNPRTKATCCCCRVLGAENGGNKLPRSFYEQKRSVKPVLHPGSSFFAGIVANLGRSIISSWVAGFPEPAVVRANATDVPQSLLAGCGSSFYCGSRPVLRHPARLWFGRLGGVFYGSKIGRASCRERVFLLV